MSKEQIKKHILGVKAILDALREAVETAGRQGVSGGTLYAALMQHGADQQQFNQLMQILIDAGRIELRGQHYYAK